MDQPRTYTTSRIASAVGIHPNTVRLYERIGFITAPERLANGYRVYSAADLDRLAIIRALRAANYSLAAILRLLDALDRDATADIGHVLDHPDPDDDILSVCDRLLTSLDAAERNAFEMIELLERMKKLA